MPNFIRLTEYKSSNDKNFLESKMNDLIINEQTIQNKIYTIRGMQVMLDRDFTELYMVNSKVLNQAVNRNIERFAVVAKFETTASEGNFVNVCFEMMGRVS